MDPRAEKEDDRERGIFLPLSIRRSRGMHFPGASPSALEVGRKATTLKGASKDFSGMAKQLNLEVPAGAPSRTGGYR